MARIELCMALATPKGPNTLKDPWLSAMRDGLALAGAAVPAVEDLVCAFLGLAP